MRLSDILMGLIYHMTLDKLMTSTVYNSIKNQLLMYSVEELTGRLNSLLYLGHAFHHPSGWKVCCSSAAKIQAHQGSCSCQKQR